MSVLSEQINLGSTCRTDSRGLEFMFRGKRIKDTTKEIIGFFFFKFATTPNFL